MPRDPIALALAAARKKASSVTRRASSKTTSQPPIKCAALGCKLQTQRAMGQGLSDLYCRKHVEFVSRHGSSWRKTFTREELAPYRRAAKAYLTQLEANPFVVKGLAELNKLMKKAGPVLPPSELAASSPRVRAKGAWARLRERRVSPFTIAADCLAVLALVADENASSPRDREFRDVQLAKVTYRKASGWTHTRTVDTGGHGFGIIRKTLHAEPRGLMLRYLGADLAKVLEDMVTRGEVLAVSNAARGFARKSKSAR